MIQPYTYPPLSADPTTLAGQRDPVWISAFALAQILIGWVEKRKQSGRRFGVFSLIDGVRWTLRWMQLETGYADVDGARLYYETSGEGPALILIHTRFLDGRMWDGQFQMF